MGETGLTQKKMRKAIWTSAISQPNLKQYQYKDHRAHVKEKKRGILRAKGLKRVRDGRMGRGGSTSV